ncbi:MAG: MarR family transcriptional regulator [Betaproteobacteria bacterium]|nr:MarR family transcriptional regulator [Betaproteobacteria bacterium]
MSNTPTTRLRDMLDIAQDEMIMRDRIADILEQGPRTIPEISQALGYPTREVTVWLFGMRRYSMVEEIGRADMDGYFQYELKKQSDPA